MGNSIGRLFIVTSFGESHGKCVGAIIDGCPAGLSLTEEVIQQEIDKRKPVIKGTTARREKDKVEILSGIYNGFTTGAPICLMIYNEDVDSSKYEEIKEKPRPGHADYPAFMKYAGFNDHRGGGRFSGRITAGFVMAGAVAKALLARLDTEIVGYITELGGVAAKGKSLEDIRNNVRTSKISCADPESEAAMLERIRDAINIEDSIGGVIACTAINVPAGLGEPVFDTLEGDLSKALFAIPAVKGVEFGDGFRAAKNSGSTNNDEFCIREGKVYTKTNRSGGILGGISDSMPLELRVAFKPTPSIGKKQHTVDLKEMKEIDITIHGRHDSCIVPRAVVVVESMVAITLCDFAIRAGIIKGVLR